MVVPDAETGELTLGPEFRPADLIIKHLDVRVRVILLVDTNDEDGLKESRNLRAAGLVLRHWPDTTAVALVANDDDLTCLVVDPFDVEPTIAAPSGAALPPTPRRVPMRLEAAVQAYLDVIVPSWENIPAGSTREPFQYEERARRVSSEVGEEISSRRAQIDEKRSALDSISRSDMTWVSKLVERAVERRLTARNVADDVSQRAGKS